jgi:trigger factor
MKITQSKAKDLVAKLTVEVSASDYTEQVENILKDYRKKVVVPGFRKGKTPMSIIEKKYKESVIVEEVNKLIQDDLYKYITENKVQVLGSPLPLDENQINWKEAKDFEFLYEIGLSPEFDLKITKKDKLDYHKINVDSKLVKQYCDDIAKRNGEMNNVDTSEEGDLVFCSIKQLDAKGIIILDGVSNEATVSMDHISDKGIKRKFIGLKTNDILNINVMKAFTNHADLAAMLAISREEIKTLSSVDFQFTIKKINRLKPAELNKELFAKVFPT